MISIVFGIVFFILIMLSVALHEVGHLLPAKRFGVRVSQYFVGFGPTLWSFKRGETEYGLKWVPLGGYVRLLGMYPPSKDKAEKSRLEAMADEAREVEWDEITETDVLDKRLVYQKKTWQKIVIMFGGPCVNLVIAFLLFWGVAGIFGSWQTTTGVAAVQPCVILEAGRDQCLDTDPKSPASEAGLLAGDTIVSFNGTEIANRELLVKLIRENLDGEARITVDRNGQRVELVPVHTLIVDGNPELTSSQVVPIGYLGFTAATEHVTGGPVEVFGQMWEMTKQSYVALVQLPANVWKVFSDIITGQERSQDSPMSIFGASVVAGEVAAADNVGVGAKVALFASLLGSLNLFLALLNLIPLPPLDGGHIAGAIYEGLRRRLAKLRKLPDPGPVDTAKLLPLTYIVAGFLLICGVALILADIISPVRLF
jgi:membrane-associated protease RseP (regulator of RpoE activity)